MSSLTSEIKKADAQLRANVSTEYDANTHIDKPNDPGLGEAR